jgi:hypothetical protein
VRLAGERVVLPMVMERVVAGAALRVDEDGVRFNDLPEALVGGKITRMGIGMMLAGKPAEGQTDGGPIGVSRHLKCGVIVW